MLGCEGKQSQMSCSLDCNGETALVLGARTRLAAGFDLASLGKKTTQRTDVFVVDFLGFL
jgi:hypothetical protein